MISDNLFYLSSYFMEKALKCLGILLAAPLIFIFSLPIAFILTCLESFMFSSKTENPALNFIKNLGLCLFAPLAVFLLFPIVLAITVPLSIFSFGLGVLSRIAEHVCCCRGEDNPNKRYRDLLYDPVSREARNENARNHVFAQEYGRDIRRNGLAREAVPRNNEDKSRASSDTRGLTTRLMSPSMPSHQQHQQQQNQQEQLIQQLREQLQIERRLRMEEKAQAQHIHERLAEINREQDQVPIPRPSAPWPDVAEHKPTPPTDQELYDEYFIKERTRSSAVNEAIESFWAKPWQSLRPPHILGGPLTGEQFDIMQKQLEGKDPIFQELFKFAVTDQIIHYDQPLYIPVLIADGRAYNLATLYALSEDKQGFRTSPENPAVKFKMNEVVPYNTLGKAIRYLLDDIQGQKEEQKQETTEPVYGRLTVSQIKTFSTQQIETAEEAEKNSLTPEDRDSLEMFYQSLTARQKRLFDIKFRDPITGHIFKRPVFLPDGFVYDYAVIQAYINQADYRNQISWPCPLNPSIKFNRSQILDCFALRDVFNVLKPTFKDHKQKLRA